MPARSHRTTPCLLARCLLARCLLTRCFLAASILALALSACGGPATSPRTAAATSDEGWLAWSAVDEGSARTTWLDARGQPVGEREGIVIATGEDLVAIERRVETVALPTCEELEASRPAAGGGETGIRTRLVAVSLSSGEQRTLVEPLDVAGAAQLRHEVVPVASLGPYLFARETADVFACGAHGNVEVAMRVLDLRTGLPVELEVPDEADLRARARDALLAEAEGALDEPLELDAVRRVATFPVLEDGRLGVEHVLTAEACYACGDGEWSSYTRATHLRGAQLPPRLATHASIPPDVSRWLADHTDVHGLSSAPDSLLSAFR